MRKYLVLFVTFISLSLSAQTSKVGVRSGLNFAKFNGPLETAVNESFSYSSGFHFGLSYTRYLMPKFGLRFEMLYIQSGTKQSIDGETYMITKLENGSNHVEYGIRKQDLTMTNAYFSVPITAHYNLSKKLEVYAGGYISFLVGPSAGGTLFFDSQQCDENGENCINPDGFFFSQSLIYDYNSDLAGGRKNALREPIIKIDGENVNVPGAIGAYYYYDEEITDSYINGFDYGLTLGLNYYLNSTFYVGARFDYGLSDVTNQDFDVSYESLNVDGSFITRDDKDSYIGLQTSFGFRF